MSHRLRVDPPIFETFPGYRLLVLYAYGLENGPSDDWSVALLRAAEHEARASFGDAKPASHPHIAAWRETFSRFGAKPSKYPCSSEALLGRVLKGQELPQSTASSISTTLSAFAMSSRSVARTSTC